MQFLCQNLAQVKCAESSVIRFPLFPVPAARCDLVSDDCSIIEITEVGYPIHATFVLMAMKKSCVLFREEGKCLHLEVYATGNSVIECGQFEAQKTILVHIIAVGTQIALCKTKKCCITGQKWQFEDVTIYQKGEAPTTLTKREQPKRPVSTIDDECCDSFPGGDQIHPTLVSQASQRIALP